MLNEREVITVAFGNYSSLVAAQWANGTSHYDAHHHTLYTECRSTDVVGGGTSGQLRTHVPRLLFLDAPYASTFDDVQAWEERYNPTTASSEGVEAAEGEQQQQQQQHRGGYMDVNASSSSSAASVLWGGGQGAGGRAANTTAAEREAQRVAGVARTVQQHMWERHGLDDDDTQSDKDAESEDEDVEDHYTRLRRELGIAPLQSYRGDVHDEEQQQQQQQGTEEEDEEDTTRNNIPRHKLTQQKQMARLKHRLFDAHNTVTPWWQYITTGLALRSVTSVKPLQHVDAAGDIPALHSFGYGVANLRSEKRAEVDGLSDALRAQLESADQLQGVQCFVDGDGMFGGAAANVMGQFWEEAGSKTPVVLACTFTPLPTFITDVQQGRHVAFRERRLDEAALNQLLATCELSRHSSAVYIPMPLADWGDFFRGASTATSRKQVPGWLQDERATAQYIAAVLDTALYGVRDGNSTHLNAAKRGRSGATAGSVDKEDDSDNAVLRAQGPVYYMEDWCRVVRPAPSLRVAAAMGSLPQPVAQSRELWQFLETNPLLPEAPVLDERMPNGLVDEPCDASMLRSGFVPLTHAMSVFSPLHSSGQVLGHAVSLRGAGMLPSTVYPTREAMLRYALPLGTSTYLPLVTASNYPLSSTFPLELLLADPAAMEKQLPRGLGSLRETLKSVDVGAHVLSTYASAPMLQGVVTRAQAVLRHKMDRYCSAYEMEKDEWREVVDEGMAMHDDYHHAAPTTQGESDGEDY